MSRGHIRAPLVVLLFIAVLSGCAKEAATEKKNHITPPTDEATPEQRAQIDETLSSIEGFTRELGKPMTFRSLPVVVTTDDKTYTDHPAACVRETTSGEGQFILIKPSVFENEADLKLAGIESTIFRVLLHEIGHCYFGREHEEDRLSEEGKTIELTIKRGGVSEPLDYSVLDATVMVPEELTLPIVLEKYYVAEILGMARAKTPSDLASFVKVKLVRSQELVVRP